MKEPIKILLRIAAFVVAFLVIFSALSNLFQPVWRHYNNYNTMYGFYEEPEDTIETLFVGSSVTVSGIIPMQLYEDYGICAYNLGTERQPVRGSYALLQETYRLHSDTLTTVCLEISAIRVDAKDAFVHKYMDVMPLSPVKIQAALEYTDYDLGDAMNFLVPFVSYHSRWSELSTADFDKGSYEKVNGTRGYYIRTGTVVQMDRFEFTSAKNTNLNTEAKPKDLNEVSVEYLDKIVSFCKEKGLKLVLFRTPSANWNSGYHIALEQLIEEKQYDVEFFDFNYAPLVDELDYLNQLDRFDSNHLNYFGAQKLTNWFGAYLTEECGATDVRGNEKYAFMEEQLALYRENTAEPAALLTTTDVTEYLDISAREGWTVLISVRGDAARALTAQQREFFAQKGLTALSTLGENDAYVAIVENGYVMNEVVKTDAEAKEDKSVLSLNGTLANGKSYQLTSGGDNCGDTASILINEKEQAQNEAGLNFVVYNHADDAVVNQTVFDTSSGRERDVYTAQSVTMVKNAPYGVYEEGSFNARLQAYVCPNPDDVMEENELFTLLEKYWDDENKVILFAVKDEASEKLRSQQRALLEEYGLTTLAQIGYRDAYIGIVDGGEVKLEMLDSDAQYIVYEEDIFSFVSAGYRSGYTSSIKVNGKEYSQNERGLNVVVYDKQLKQVVWSGNFDTNSVSMLIPE